MRAALLLALAPVVAALPPQESRPASRPEALHSAVETRMRATMQRQELVGLSVALIRAGRPPLCVGLGLEDREAGIPVSPETRYRWASISKPLTAVAAMQLVEAQRLDLERDVRTWVPEFPEQEFVITVRHLLCHQGGIVHYTNGKVAGTRRDYTVPHPFADVVVALDRFNASPLLCRPGTAMNYTTHGYILLGAVVQRAGGARFAEQVAARIAGPLGMRTLEPDYQWVAIPHRAVGYRKMLGRVVRSSDTDVSWKLPGGGFISTVEDLARFGAGLLDGRLVSAATRSRMWTPQKLADGSATSYGLGFAIARRGGRALVSHSGSQEKTATLLLLLPEEGCGVAVMCNTERAALRSLANDLLDLLARDGTSSQPASRPAAGGPRRPEAR